MADTRFARMVRSSLSVAILIAFWGFAAPRLTLADCCNCDYDLGPPTGVVLFCEGNDLTACPISSTGFSCGGLISGGTCSPSNNVVNSVCVAPTSTPTVASTPTPTLVPLGGTCDTDPQCVSKSCVDDVCIPEQGAPVVSSSNTVFLIAGLLVLGLWSVRRSARRR